MKRKANSNESPFNPNQVKREFDRAWPKVILEVADLLEQPVPRLTKRAKKQISQEFSSSFDAVTPHVRKLEEIKGDPGRLQESYENLEKILREYLSRSDLRIRLGEDAFDCFIRQSELLLRAPYVLKRLKQFRVVRAGVQMLVRSAMAAPTGVKTSEDLIKEFGREHSREYFRFANSVDARLKSCQNIDFSKFTVRNITRISDIYRDIAAAFENRLRLLVGLNFIAVGKPKTYSELRRFGYNQLLQAVESPKHPLLHFLNGTVNRNVRNALSHNGVSSRRSKRSVVFVDYSPSKGKTEMIWSLSQFGREARKLLLTILGAAYIENEYIYVLNYCRVAGIREMIFTQSQSKAASNRPA